MVPVMSLLAAGCGLSCGIATVAVLSGSVSIELLSDCRPIGVGEVNDGAAGAGIAGFALSLAGGRRSRRGLA